MCVWVCYVCVPVGRGIMNKISTSLVGYSFQFTCNHHYSILTGELRNKYSDSGGLGQKAVKVKKLSQEFTMLVRLCHSKTWNIP